VLARYVLWPVSVRLSVTSRCYLETAAWTHQTVFGIELTLVYISAHCDFIFCAIQHLLTYLLTLFNEGIQLYLKIKVLPVVKW